MSDVDWGSKAQCKAVVARFHHRHECEAERREMIERGEELERELTKLVDVAEKHGWNGVENSKLLYVFFDTALEERKQLEAHLVGARNDITLLRAEVVRLDTLLALKHAECWRNLTERNEAQAENARLKLKKENLHLNHEAKLSKLRGFAQEMQHGEDCDPAEDWCECGLDNLRAALEGGP